MYTYTWKFKCHDNGGKFQQFNVKADNKTDAINKGMERAKKHANGDIHSWECILVLRMGF